MLRLDDLLSGIASQDPVLLSRGRDRFGAIAHDSRNVEGGELFVAVRTASGDGHTHLEEAFSRGASGFLVEQAIDELAPWGRPGWAGPTPTVVRVRSTRQALVAWARQRLDLAEVVVVAGSLGKSTAQGLIRLGWAATTGPAVAGNGDRNDSFGVPVALGAMPEGVRRVVLEVVASDRGEEDRLRSMLRPRVLCVTSTSGARSLYWRSSTALAASLARVFPASAKLVLPAADSGLARAFRGRPRVSFGPLGSGADVEAGPEAGGPAPDWPGAWRCRVQALEHRWSVSCQLHPRVGGPALGALAATLAALGEDPGPGLEAVSEAAPLPGRLRPLAGAEGGLVLDDTADMTPESLRLCLEVLQGLPAPRTAVLGSGAGKLPRTRPATSVLVVDGSKALPDPGRASGVTQTLGPADAQRVAEGILAAGGTVAVKGSASQRMERMTARLVAPGQPLVRQDRGRRLMRFRSPRRPTWVEIDVGALEANVAELVDELSPSRLMAVVKADAYGHGAVQVAGAALRSGAEWVAVATLAEASLLRRAGVDAPCLLLGYTPPHQVEEAVRLGLVVTVSDAEVLEALETAGERIGGRARAHLKVDTGMSRLGLAPAAVADFVEAAERLPHVDLEGVYTHFRKGHDPVVTRAQLERLAEAVRQAEARGHHFRLRHAASSSSWATVPEARLDLVRCGGELLGLRTGDGRQRRPVLAFKTTVAQLRGVGPGDFVGYGDVFRADREMTVATIPVGYGDGFRRGPGNWGRVLIRGRAHPLVGDVCMDLAMVDVSADPAIRRGDEVVLIGAQGAARMSAEDVAERMGTVAYEVVSQILPRVPREAPGWGPPELE